MHEMVVEAIPFGVGAVIGWLTFRPEARGLQAWSCIAAGALALGLLQAWFAREITPDWLESGIAIIADAAAVAVGWVGVQVALKQMRRFAL